jgi:zinc protease
LGKLSNASASPSPAPSGDTLPRGDSGVVVGKLANGLTYYVRRNAEPPHRAELRLVVNAGSVLEDDDQRGLAHVVEHMAFNGTRRFAAHQIVDFLESVGMRFGPDVNAYTGFDETVYILSLPTDTAGVLDRGLDVLEDWATAISFDTAEVRKERGVVIEEWRLGRGAGARIRDRQFPVLFAGSRYAERTPIGDPETLPHRAGGRDPPLLPRLVPPRPDVGGGGRRLRPEAGGGDDPRALRPHPRASGRAAAAPRSASPATRTRASPSSPTARLTGSSVDLVRTVPARTRRTRVAVPRRGSWRSLYGGMLDHRLSDLTQRPDAPFLNVSQLRGSLLRGWTPTT